MSLAGRKQRYDNSIRKGNLEYAEKMNDAPAVVEEVVEEIVEEVVEEKEKTKKKKE